MNLLNSLKTLALALILSVGIGYAYAAWAPPTNPPTGGNAEAPVNVGSATQLKVGGLAIRGLLEVGSSAAVVPGPLILKAFGKIGADEYCDRSGTNCTDADALGGGSGGTPLNPEFISCQVGPGVGACSVSCTGGRIIVAYGLAGSSNDADYTTHSASISGGNTLNVSQGSMNNEFARYGATCVNPIFAAGNGNYTTHSFYSHNHNTGGGNYNIPGRHKLCTWAGVQQWSSGNGIGGNLRPRSGDSFDADGKIAWTYYSGGEGQTFYFSCFD